MARDEGLFILDCSLFQAPRWWWWKVVQKCEKRTGAGERQGLSQVDGLVDDDRK